MVGWSGWLVVGQSVVAGCDMDSAAAAAVCGLWRCTSVMRMYLYFSVNFPVLWLLLRIKDVGYITRAAWEFIWRLKNEQDAKQQVMCVAYCVPLHGGLL